MFYMVAHCMKRTSETVYLHAMVHESYVKAETPRERAQIKKKEKLIPPHDFKFFLPISILCAVGIFNRPTFPAFVVVPLFYWFQRGVINNSIVTPFQMFNFRMASMIPGFAIFILLLDFAVLTKCFNFTKFQRQSWTKILLKLEILQISVSFTSEALVH